MELKYDLAPTAALAAGLAFASRRRWVAAGVVLGIGAGLKWTPGLAALTLVLWLAASGRRWDAVRHGAAAAGAFLVVNLPFLVVAPGLIAHTYRAQAGRGITGESFQYLVLHALGRGQIPPNSPFYSAIVTPHWATTASSLFQIACVLSRPLLRMLTRGRPRRRDRGCGASSGGIAADDADVGRQFLVTALALGLAMAAAMVERVESDQLAVAALGCTAALANVLVYPTVTPTYWWACSWLLFVAAFAAVGLLLVRTWQLDGSEMERAGIEPATSGLQSRRSPS